MDLWASRGHPQVLLKEKMPIKVADIWVSTEVEFQAQHLTKVYLTCGSEDGSSSSRDIGSYQILKGHTVHSATEMSGALLLIFQDIGGGGTCPCAHLVPTVLLGT